MAKWIHSRKGLIDGELIEDDGTWTRIKATGDQNLRSARPGGVLEYFDGETITVRTSYLTALPD